MERAKEDKLHCTSWINFTIWVRDTETLHRRTSCLTFHALFLYLPVYLYLLSAILFFTKLLFPAIMILVHICHAKSHFRKSHCQKHFFSPPLYRKNFQLVLGVMRAEVMFSFSPKSISTAAELRCTAQFSLAITFWQLSCFLLNGSQIWRNSFYYWRHLCKKVSQFLRRRGRKGGGIWKFHNILCLNSGFW